MKAQCWVEWTGQSRTVGSLSWTDCSVKLAPSWNLVPCLPSNGPILSTCNFRNEAPVWKHKGGVARQWVYCPYFWAVWNDFFDFHPTWCSTPACTKPVLLNRGNFIPDSLLLMKPEKEVLRNSESKLSQLFYQSQPTEKWQATYMFFFFES
jgi:hypothetical protein